MKTFTQSACPYCGGQCALNKCVHFFTPIAGCGHKDSVDGCCSHPDNMTPECHVDACPMLTTEMRKWIASRGDAKDVQAKAFDAAVIEFRVRWDGVMRKAVIFTFGGLALVIVAAWAWKSVN